MKNGKTNNFKNFHKIQTHNKIKHIDKIIWNKNLSKEKKVPIKDIIYSLQMAETEISKKLEIKLDSYLNYNVLGHILTDNDPIYLITDDCYKVLYISIGKSHPIFWYKFTTKKDFTNSFDNIYEKYTKTEYDMNMSKSVKVFVGDINILSINIHDIENHLLLQKYTDKLIYGSMWKDHPFRDEYKNSYIDPIKSVILTGQAMRQDEKLPYCVNVRTLYSKSLITMYDYDDIFILEIAYNPVVSNQVKNINSLLERNYNNDIPIDVLISIFGFPFITHTDIIKMKPLTRYHIFILSILVMHDSDLVLELAEDFKKLIENKDNDNFDEVVYDEINSYLKLSNDLKLFRKIIQDKEIDDMIESNKVNELEKCVATISKKYNCSDNEFIKQELKEFILMHFDDSYAGCDDSDCDCHEDSEDSEYTEDLIN
jgi:hypothetical protein